MINVTGMSITITTATVTATKDPTGAGVAGAKTGSLVIVNNNNTY